MISPSTPAALAEIAVGAGPSTRTIVAAGHHPGVLSMFVATNHDPPSTAIGVAGIPENPCRLPRSRLLAPGRAIGTSQDFAHR